MNDCKYTDADPPKETIFGQVVGKANNYMAVPDGQGGRRIIKNERIRRYESSFMSQCVKYRNASIDTRFELEIDVYCRSWSYDLDNALKTVLDCLQYVGAIANDKLCRRISASKFIDPHNPRVEFVIRADPKPPTLF